MLITRHLYIALIASLSTLFPTGPLYADSLLPFGIVGTPIDLSSSVHDSIIPGGTVFQDSKPLFGTTPSPVQSSNLLYFSDGVNAAGRSTNIKSAFASSLAESNGNGGVGVSQLIFGPPGGSGDGIRQLVAQSLWTQTFVNRGTENVDIKLHLHIPALQVQLFGVPPRQTVISATETAEASAKLASTITRSDLTQITGSGVRLRPA